MTLTLRYALHDASDGRSEELTQSHEHRAHDEQSKSEPIMKAERAVVDVAGSSLLEVAREPAKCIIHGEGWTDAGLFESIPLDRRRFRLD